MTTLATGLALVPLVISGNKPGHEIEHPMAVVIVGGLVTSTLLNLFVVPALYLRFGKNKESRTLEPAERDAGQARDAGEHGSPAWIEQRWLPSSADRREPRCRSARTCSTRLVDPILRGYHRRRVPRRREWQLTRLSRSHARPTGPA